MGMVHDACASMKSSTTGQGAQSLILLHPSLDYVLLVLVLVLGEWAIYMTQAMMNIEAQRSSAQYGSAPYNTNRSNKIISKFRIRSVEP